MPWQKPPGFIKSCLFSARLLSLTLALNLLASPLYSCVVCSTRWSFFTNSSQCIFPGKRVWTACGISNSWKMNQCLQKPRYFLNGMVASIIWIVLLNYWLQFYLPVLFFIYGQKQRQTKNHFPKESSPIELSFLLFLIS